MVAEPEGPAQRSRRESVGAALIALRYAGRLVFGELSRVVSLSAAISLALRSGVLVLLFGPMAYAYGQQLGGRHDRSFVAETLILLGLLALATGGTKPGSPIDQLRRDCTNAFIMSIAVELGLAALLLVPFDRLVPIPILLFWTALFVALGTWVWSRSVAEAYLRRAVAELSLAPFFWTAVVPVALVVVFVAGWILSALFLLGETGSVDVGLSLAKTVEALVGFVVGSVLGHVFMRPALVQFNRVRPYLVAMLWPVTGLAIAYFATILTFAGIFAAAYDYHLNPERLTNAPAQPMTPSCATTKGSPAELRACLVNEPFTRIEPDGSSDKLGGEATFLDFLYFSMNTIAPLGYSDIRPNSIGMRIAAFVEFVLGTGWVVVVFGALIGYMTTTWDDLAMRRRAEADQESRERTPLALRRWRGYKALRVNLRDGRDDGSRRLNQVAQRSRLWPFR